MSKKTWWVIAVVILVVLVWWGYSSTTAPEPVDGTGQAAQISRIGGFLRRIFQPAPAPTTVSPLSSNYKSCWKDFASCMDDQEDDLQNCNGSGNQGENCMENHLDEDDDDNDDGVDDYPNDLRDVIERCRAAFPNNPTALENCISDAFDNYGTTVTSVCLRNVAIKQVCMNNWDVGVTRCFNNFKNCLGI